MKDTAIVEFVNGKEKTDIEVPLDITANDLIIALNNCYRLDMDIENIFNCYLISENPIAFLRGNKTLREYGIRNGSWIIYKRSGSKVNENDKE